MRLILWFSRSEGLKTRDLGNRALSNNNHLSLIFENGKYVTRNRFYSPDVTEQCDNLFARINITCKINVLTTNVSEDKRRRYDDF